MIFSFICHLIFHNIDVHKYMFYYSYSSHFIYALVRYRLLPDGIISMLNLQKGKRKNDKNRISQKRSRKNRSY